MNNRVQSVKSPAIISLTVIFLLQFLSGFSVQGEVQNDTIADVEALKASAESIRANVFSPVYFKRGDDALQKAIDDLSAGKTQKRIQKQLSVAGESFKRAIAAADNLQSVFPDLIVAYDASMTAKAFDLSPETQEKAQKLFDKIVAKVEKGDIESARKNSAEAVRLFKLAELESITLRILQPVYDLRQAAELAQCPVNTPGLFTEAAEAVEETETFIEQNRYEFETAGKMADEAGEILSHAVYLSNWISRLKENPTGWEDVIQQFEWYVEDISASLHLYPDLNQDISIAVETILAAIRSLQDDRRYLQEELAQRDERIGSLEAETNSIRGQSGKYLAELEQKRREILGKQRYEEKVARVTSLFSENEGIIVRATSGQTDKIIIRLTGLNFKSGSSELNLGNFDVLTKVQHVIREFPMRHIEVQGHTDSKGNDNTNLILSEDRARAVKDYLVANMNLPENRITAAGFGESKPLATNETAAGRMQNRRIEIVLE